MKPIIKAEELQALSGQENFVIIDATSGAEARKTYESSHLLNALFVDLDRDLSAVNDPRLGGRHPLPSVAAFSETLSTLGIDAESHIVVYDRLNAANAAARFWWMARAAGVKKVQVLDGGFRAAREAGFPLSEGEELAPEPTTYRFEQWQLPTKALEEIDAWTIQDSKLIIDVREAARYEGLTEPIDLIAGHIPSAINVPFMGNLNSDGFFKDPEMLRLLYAPILGRRDAKDIAIHCGSGVTACHSILALAHAGYDIPNLYVGSWSEWSRNDLPREPKD